MKQFMHMQRVPAPREDRLAGDPIVPKLLLPKPRGADGEGKPPPEQSCVPWGKPTFITFSTRHVNSKANTKKKIKF